MDRGEIELPGRTSYAGAGMTDRPIPLSASKVRALLDGRKTQERLILKPQPGPCTHKPYDKGTAEFRPSIDDGVAQLATQMDCGRLVI